MAPSRKSRSVNRRIPLPNDVPLGKAEGEATKNCQRKRKLVDTLGPEWSNEELECFYEAYRKYGRDWKKVAAAVRYRSADMVEALFNINRAYLSLPEGAASAVGLVAMMTDHYAMMERSDSERDNCDRADSSRKPQKLPHAILPQNNSKKIDRSLPDLPKFNLDIPDLFKKRRSASKTRAVGRRTPRIPISYSYDRDSGEKFLSPNKQGFKQKMNVTDDYEVAHEVAAALTEASERGGSSNLSQTSKRKPVQAEVSSIRNGSGMHPGSESTGGKPHDGEFGGGCELSLGSSEGTGVGVPKKRKKHSIRMLEVKESAHSDDINEACSGTEEGEEVHVFKRKLGSRVSSIKTARSPCKSMREKGTKILSGEDRDSTFDALKTLADLSLMMPTSTADATMQIKEEKEKVYTVKQSKPKGNLSFPTEVIPLGTSEAKEAVDCEINAVEELKEKVHHSNYGTRKRKQKSSPFKIPKADASSDSSKTESKKIEGSKKKVQLSSQNTSQAKQGRTRKPPECTSRTDLNMEIDGFQSTSSINITKDKSRYNHGKQKNSENDNKSFGSIKQVKPKIPVPWLHNAALNPKERFHHFLSRSQARRWCTFEWFYSAIDYPWFARREFAEYLDHVGLGHVPCLTRVEWGVIRSSLGKPRRFSKQFLEEEREKLLQHRESIRIHHTSLRSGASEVLPVDLPQPLTVGQRIVVIHPKSREIHGGYVLTVDHSSCLVQFEQLELGIHWVKDIDCMPLNMLDNIPEALARSVQTSRKLNENSSLSLTGQLKDAKMIQFMELPLAGKTDKTDIPSDSLPSAIHIMKKLNPPEGVSSDCNSQGIIGISNSGNATLPRAGISQASDSEQDQAREADIQALSELTSALDKKEALLSELTRMNDEVSKIQKDGVNTLKDSEPFKKHYALMLWQLNDFNQQVSSALCCLRRRNSYHENVRSKCTTTLVHPTIQLSSVDLSTCKPADFGPRVSQIIKDSRTKARAMVVAAIQAASSLFKEVKNPDGFEEALDFVNDQLSAQDLLLLADSVVVNLESQDQVDASCPDCPGKIHGLNLTSTDSFAENTEKIPSELITNCVATMLMIQNCTKRQCPPSEVAEIINSAMRSLRPLCSQNLPIYNEIQSCMCMIRNQILGLVPTA